MLWHCENHGTYSTTPYVVFLETVMVLVSRVVISAVELLSATREFIVPHGRGIVRDWAQAHVSRPFTPLPEVSRIWPLLCPGPTVAGCV